MKFADHLLQIESPFGLIATRVTADALHMLRVAEGGPQDPDGLMAENRDMIGQVVCMKFEAGEVGDDGYVRVSELDLEA